MVNAISVIKSLRQVISKGLRFFGFGFWVPGSRFRFLSFGFQVSGSGSRIMIFLRQRLEQRFLLSTAHWSSVQVSGLTDVVCLQSCSLTPKLMDIWSQTTTLEPLSPIFFALCVVRTHIAILERRGRAGCPVVGTRGGANATAS